MCGNGGRASDTVTQARWFIVEFFLGVGNQVAWFSTPFLMRIQTSGAFKLQSQRILGEDFLGPLVAETFARTIAQ